LLHRIKELEMEVERLKKLTPQELINEVRSYKGEVTQLKTQLEKLNSQQSAQIEVRKWP
jgi:ribosomal protein L29